MVESTQDISSINIESELKQSYLDYAMSVIVGRALPDIRDGLKPVHRRVLYAMRELGIEWNKPYKKSARVVGDVIGKYHPHGDSAVYDTIVRMAQPFSMRYMLVDGQGNFGSIDGDNAAAMRYTEVRMTKLAHELLADLDKDTVDFVPNYDGTEMMPSVMPTKVPNLLINGASGIAVGMATNIPPHNLTEVVSAAIALLDNAELTVDDLMEYVHGPDFPTAAFINGRAGIVQAYRTGRGRVLMRSRYHIETNDRSHRETVVFTEIPYQINKAKLVERIAELVKEKKIEGIAELRDESDKDGIRVVMELKKGENAEVLVNNLYAQTQLETAFGVNMVALVDGRPQLVNLKIILEEFLKHRRRVVTRRTVYLLRKARERGHLLEGLAVALANIDPVIALIKASPSAAEAKAGLMSTPWAPGDVLQMLERVGGEEDLCRPDSLPKEQGFVNGRYNLSERQAQAILDLKLQKLTGMEHSKLLAEYQERLEEMRELGMILSNPERLVEVIRAELEDIKQNYGDNRRTEILASQHDLCVEDLIDDEPMVVTISEEGYAKAQPLDVYRAQRRGGRGKVAASFKEDDQIAHLVVASMLDTVLCFTDNGKCFWLKVYQLPQGGRSARGRPLVNIVSIQPQERVTTLLPIRDFPADHYIFMATRMGTVKKVPLEQFAKPRSQGLIALDLNEGDTLIGAAITNGQQQVMLFASDGKCAYFEEAAVRSMGRTARGVRGMRLAKGEHIISLIIPKAEKLLLLACENGYGKRTDVSEFSLKGRGGQGVRAIMVSERNGKMVSAIQVDATDDIMLISDHGTLVRTPVEGVSVSGRSAQGVVLIRLAETEKLVRVERVDEAVEDEAALDADGNPVAVVPGEGITSETGEQNPVATTSPDIDEVTDDIASDSDDDSDKDVKDE